MLDSRKLGSVLDRIFLSRVGLIRFQICVGFSLKGKKMKKIFFHIGLLAFVLLSFFGCTATRNPGGASPRFDEAGAAHVELMNAKRALAEQPPLSRQMAEAEKRLVVAQYNANVATAKAEQAQRQTVSGNEPQAFRRSRTRYHGER